MRNGNAVGWLAWIVLVTGLEDAAPRIRRQGRHKEAADYPLRELRIRAGR